MTSKISLVSLGCPRNLTDSQAIAERLKLKGAKITEDSQEADTIIINTCAFIKEAKEESIDFILDAVELKKEGRIKKIILAGCLAQRYPEEILKEFKEIDAIVGRQELTDSVNNLSLTPKHYSYLKICEGCFNECSFCVIPKIKGKFKSRSVGSVLEEARLLDKRGISELNIIGQDITCFGLDSAAKGRLSYLISRILEEAENIKWVRLLYLNPLRLDNDLIELIWENERICKYIDLPIQHINDRILKLMNRQITKSKIHSLIKRLRKEIPEVAIRTSVITGFPSETESEFKELIDFITEVKFDRLGAFVYSREEGTAAYDFPNQVPESVKRKRFSILMQKQQEIAKDYNASLLGKTKEVMIEEYNDGVYAARSQADAPEVDGCVFVKSKEKLFAGDIVKVKITQTYEYDLVGEKIPS
ncbi:MAG: MiaB/RimO family radical SAM methylthiotransferase [Candidatus Omnitrophota bacterium]|nr:MiaB/RimO family radical SAM methylthiotransferase [Candidatus Omnitrophota bacterium]